MLIDTHSHLHDPQFFTKDQQAAMLKRAHKAGVEKIICIGTDPEDSLIARDFAEKHDNVYWTYGIHPAEAKSLSFVRGLELEKSHTLGSRENRPTGEPLGAVRNIDFSNSNQDIILSKYSDLASRLVAIGEVGLDYHYEGYNREAQIKLFEQMLQLAQDNNLPVSFHVREAFDDFFAVIKNFLKLKGVIHSFSDNKKNLKRLLNETDFYIGVNGMATYSTLPTPPIERILLETDAPFLAPVPHRGEKNEPAYIPDIAEWLAQKLGLEPSEVAKITTKNAEKLFAKITLPHSSHQ